MNVYINGKDFGDHIFLQDESGEIFIRIDQFLSFELVPLNDWSVITIENKDFFSMQRMNPQLTFNINIKRAEVFINAEPELFQQQQIDFSSRNRNLEFIRPDEPSLILNYRISSLFLDNFDYELIDVPLRFSASSGQLYGTTSISYTSDSAVEENWVRQGTSFFYDQPDKLQRWVLGDFSAANDLLGGSGSFGGISFSRTFNMDPYFDIFPTPQFKGTLETASNVDIFVNDSKIETQSLRPGEFVLDNMPNTSGFGVIRVVSRDAFGNEIETSEPFYVGRGLLKPGLHDFSYNFGFIRKDVNEDFFDYSDLSFLGFHRLGLSRSFTAGIKGEADEDIWNVGLTAQSLIGHYGQVDLVAATSGQNGRSGNAFAVAYQFNWSKYNINAFAQFFDLDYVNLSKTKEEDSLRNEINVQFGFLLGYLGSLNLSYNHRNYYQKPDTTTERISLSKRISNDFSFNVLFRNFEEENFGRFSGSDEQEILVGITWLYDSVRSARYEYQSVESNQRHSISAQKSLPIGDGYGYDIKVSHDDSLQTGETLNSRFTYRAPPGVFEGLYNRFENSDSYILSMAGAFSMIDSDIHVSKPINDSMVVVKIPDIENVAVELNHQPVGTTNKKGVLVVPSLYSYRNNQVSIQDQYLPINYQFEQVMQNISPYPLSSSALTFKYKKLQAIEGTIFILDQGLRKAAEYAQLLLKFPGEEQKNIVGKRGEFYLENLPPGNINAQVILEGKSCEFSMEIPQSNELIIDLGELDCVVP